MSDLINEPPLEEVNDIQALEARIYRVTRKRATKLEKLQKISKEFKKDDDEFLEEMAAIEKKLEGLYAKEPSPDEE